MSFTFIADGPIKVFVSRRIILPGKGSLERVWIAEERESWSTCPDSVALALICDRGQTFAANSPQIHQSDFLEVDL